MKIRKRASALSEWEIKGDDWKKMKDFFNNSEKYQGIGFLTEMKHLKIQSEKPVTSNRIRKNPNHRVLNESSLD